jgi:hypothetical protein
VARSLIHISKPNMEKISTARLILGFGGVGFVCYVLMTMGSFVPMLLATILLFGFLYFIAKKYSIDATKRLTRFSMLILAIYTVFFGVAVMYVSYVQVSCGEKGPASLTCPNKPGLIIAILSMFAISVFYLTIAPIVVHIIAKKSGPSLLRNIIIAGVLYYLLFAAPTFYWFIKYV